MLAIALFHLVAAAQDPPSVADPLVFDGAASGSAPAEPEQTPADPALADDPAFLDGMRYYDKLEFEKAAFRFRTAARALDRAPVVGARAHLWLGLALAQADDEASAREAFLDARRIDDAVQLPADAPPMIRAIFDDAVTGAGATPTSDATKAKRASPGADEAMPLSLLVGAGVAGAGVLAFGGGAVSGALALSQADAAERERFQDDALAAHEGAQSMALLATGLLVTGAAAAIAGAAVIVVGAFVE